MEKRLEIIAKIKRRLAKEHLEFFFLTTGDPHLSEYPCERWKVLERVTGFSGSNGFLVLSDFGDFLWTDSRYLLQAEKELQGTSISIKQMVTGDEPLEWLASFGRFSYGVVFDGDFFSQSFTDKFRIEVVLAKQSTIDQHRYNKVLIHAILPNCIDEYHETITLTYSVDTKIPIYKIYKSYYNNNTGHIVCFNRH